MHSSVETGNSIESLTLTANIDYIEDINDMQEFKLHRINKSSTNATNTHNDYTRYMRLTFPTSTDFYGRITIYILKIYGYEEQIYIDG